MPPPGSGPPYRHPSSTSVGTHPGTPRLSKALGPQVHIDIAPLNPKALGLQGPCRHPSSKGVGHAPSATPPQALATPWPHQTKHIPETGQVNQTKKKTRNNHTCNASARTTTTTQTKNVMPACAHHKARHRAAPIYLISQEAQGSGSLQFRFVCVTRQLLFSGF